MEKKTQMVNMRYSIFLLEKIDYFKREGGYSTRSEAIFALIRKGLESNERRE